MSGKSDTILLCTLEYQNDGPSPWKLESGGFRITSYDFSNHTAPTTMGTG